MGLLFFLLSWLFSFLLFWIGYYLLFIKNQLLFKRWFSSISCKEFNSNMIEEKFKKKIWKILLFIKMLFEFVNIIMLTLKIQKFGEPSMLISVGWMICLDLKIATFALININQNNSNYLRDLSLNLRNERSDSKISFDFLLK